MEEQNNKNVTKEELVTIIKEWIKIDNDIKKIKNDVKEKNNKKKILTENLMSVMKNNKIECFDINGGSLVYKRNKSKKAINSKNLIAILNEYYKDTAEALNVAKFILENREEVYTEVIKHKIDK